MDANKRMKHIEKIAKKLEKIYDACLAPCEDENEVWSVLRGVNNLMEERFSDVVDRWVLKKRRKSE